MCVQSPHLIAPKGLATPLRGLTLGGLARESFTALRVRAGHGSRGGQVGTDALVSGVRETEAIEVMSPLRSHAAQVISFGRVAGSISAMPARASRSQMRTSICALTSMIPLLLNRRSVRQT